MMHKLPSTLLHKIETAGLWENGWTASNNGREQLATAFRLEDGRKLELVVERDGTILLLLNPLAYTRGEPVGPEFFDFDKANIVALVGRRKVGSRLWPFGARFEDFDLVRI
jgi:hypothetical protein